MLCNESHFLPKSVKPATDHGDHCSKVSILLINVDFDIANLSQPPGDRQDLCR
jgi:hypothetical protein